MGNPIVARTRDSAPRGPLVGTVTRRPRPVTHPLAGLELVEPPAGTHSARVGTYADVVRVREPVARPLDIVAVELLLTASQAFLAGVLLYMAVGFWEDAGVGLASTAAILALLGLGVGAAWLFWLLGGVGWPMAAVDTAAGLFFLFTLVMGWSVESFDIGGAPLVLATAAAVFGVVAGVFLDSPRRWRWDQRERLRPGTQVPRVSPTTQALVAQVPRSLPHREAEPETMSELAARIESATPPATESSGEADTGAGGDDGLAGMGTYQGVLHRRLPEAYRSPSFRDLGPARIEPKLAGPTHV